MLAEWFNSCWSQKVLLKLSKATKSTNLNIAVLFSACIVHYLQDSLTVSGILDSVVTDQMSRGARPQLTQGHVLGKVMHAVRQVLLLHESHKKCMSPDRVAFPVRLFDCIRARQSTPQPKWCSGHVAKFGIWLPPQKCSTPSVDTQYTRTQLCPGHEYYEMRFAYTQALMSYCRYKIQWATTVASVNHSHVIRRGNAVSHTIKVTCLRSLLQPLSYQRFQLLAQYQYRRRGMVHIIILSI